MDLNDFSLRSDQMNFSSPIETRSADMKQTVDSNYGMFIPLHSFCSLTTHTHTKHSNDMQRG